VWLMIVITSHEKDDIISWCKSQGSILWDCGSSPQWRKL